MNRLVLLLPTAVALVAQEVPTSLTTVTSEFLAAIESGDVAKLASLTHFPIKSNEFKHITSMAELSKAIPVIFTKERKAGLIGQKPVFRSNGIYSLSSKDQNDPIQFLFKKFGNQFKFYLIDNINE